MCLIVLTYVDNNPLINIVVLFIDDTKGEICVCGNQFNSITWFPENIKLQLVYSILQFYGVI